MIQDYKTQLQAQLTASLVSQRATLTEHLKAIEDRRREAQSIREALAESVDGELKIIHENEHEYHRLQSEHHKLQSQIEEQRQAYSQSDASSQHSSQGGTCEKLMMFTSPGLDGMNTTPDKVPLYSNVALITESDALSSGSGEGGMLSLPQKL